MLVQASCVINPDERVLPDELAHVFTGVTHPDALVKPLETVARCTSVRRATSPTAPRHSFLPRRSPPGGAFPSDVALEAMDDLSLALVLLCAKVPAHLGQADHVQRTIGLSVATMVGTVP